MTNENQTAPHGAARVRNFVVRLGLRPEVVALASLLTLAAFFWPICRSSLGLGSSAASLSEEDRADLIAAALARLEEDARRAIEEGLDGSIEHRIEAAVDLRMGAVRTIAEADRSDAAHPVDSSLVVQALAGIAKGQFEDAEAILHRIAEDQSAAGDREGAIDTYREAAGLFSEISPSRGLTAHLKAAELNPSDPFLWYQISILATRLGREDIRYEALRNALANVDKAKESDRALLLTLVGDESLATGDFEAAIRAATSVFDAVRAQFRARPDDLRSVWNGGAATWEAADDLMAASTEHDALAVAAARDAIEAWKSLRRQEPEAFDEIHYGEALLQLSLVLIEAGDFAGAREAAQEASEIHRSAVQDAPRDRHVRIHAVDDAIALARALIALEELDAANAVVQVAAESAAWLNEMAPDSVDSQHLAATLHGLAGRLAIRDGDPESAVREFRTEDGVWAAALAAAPRDLDLANRLFANRADYAESLADHDFAAAVEFASAARAIAQDLQARGVLFPRHLPAVASVEAVLAASEARVIDD